MADAALCVGWAATQTLELDRRTCVTEWRRRTRDDAWSDLELAAASRLIETGRMDEAGRRALPPDFRAPGRE
jgi:hypothetical protein